MTAATSAPWLLALVTANDADELLSIGVAGCAAGLGTVLFECHCRAGGLLGPVTFPALVRHVRIVEEEWRAVRPGDPDDVDAPVTALHRLSDLQLSTQRPASAFKRRGV
jgi:hypothetical protein